MSRSKAAILGYTEYRDRDQKKDERDGEHAFAPGGGKDALIALLQNGLAIVEAAGRQAWHKYLARYLEEKGEKESQLQQYIQQLEEGLYTERDGATEKYENRLETLDADFGAKSARHEFLKKAENDAAAELAIVKSRLTPSQRPLRVHFRRTYVPFMMVLAVLEAPLNRLSFELFFAEIPILSLILALVAGVGLMFFAHMIGSILRSLPTRPTPSSLAAKIVSALFVFLLAYSLMFGIALLRQSYINYTQQDANAPNLAAALAAGGVERFAGAILAVSLEAMGYIFLVLNLVVFVVGGLAAFFRHDPDPDYEPAVRKLQNAKQKFEDLKEVANKKRAKIMKEREESMIQINNAIQSAESERDKIQGEIENLRRAHDADKATVISVLDRRLKAYRAGFARKVPPADVAELNRTTKDLRQLEALLDEGSLAGA